VARFKPARGLDEQIAQRFGRPVIERALEMLTEEAQRRAPGTRVWVTMRDERVRTSHFNADGQVIPDNLRFKVERPGMAGDYELARHPRDPNLSAANAINCRCDDPGIPHLLRQSIHHNGVHVVGTRVSGEVETRFPRAAESEFGTSGDEAAHYFTNALREVALRLQSGHSR
jgi:hypothetical protein